MAANLDPTIPPVYLQVAAMDFPGKFRKGDIVEVYASGTLKSDWCVPPDWCWAEITDRSKNQVNAYLTGWNIQFVQTLMNQNATRWRFRIEVDPVYISASELGKYEIKQEMTDYINGHVTHWASLWYKCSIVSFNNAGIVIDIPKPYQGNTMYDGTDPEWILMWETNHTGFLKELRDDFHDKFATVLDIRRYYFNPDSVDIIIGQGGEWVGTHTQALNHIIDKLSE